MKLKIDRHYILKNYWGKYKVNFIEYILDRVIVCPVEKNNEIVCV